MPSILYLATQNAGKVRELQAFCQNVALNVKPAPQNFEVEETGLTFAANAEQKAQALATYTNAPALADDSGIAVDALGGRPGIYSARLSGVLGPDQDRANRAALLHLMKNLEGPAREASMVCALVIAWPDGRRVRAQSRVRGLVVAQPRGSLGFGYDSIFCSLGMRETWGELEDAERWAQSHRRQALESLNLSALALTL